MAPRRANKLFCGARRCRVLERIWSPWRTKTLASRSQGKSKMVPIIMGKSGLCLSGCSSITELARTMGLGLFERSIAPVSSHLRLWALVLELGASEVWHYLEISGRSSLLSLIMYSSYMQGGMNSVWDSVKFGIIWKYQ